MISAAFDVQYDAHPGPAEMPLVDATFTMFPRRSIRCGSAARLTRNGPVTLIVIVRSQSRSVSSPAGTDSATPWLHTSTSRPPNASTVPCTACAAPSSVATSAATATASPPAAVSAVTASASGAARRPTTATA